PRSLAALRRAFSLVPQIMTSAPRSQSASAKARPMPRVPPVMRIFFIASCIVVVLPLGKRGWKQPVAVRAVLRFAGRDLHGGASDDGRSRRSDDPGPLGLALEA